MLNRTGNSLVDSANRIGLPDHTPQKVAAGEQLEQAALPGKQTQLREVFDDFVGQTFYAQMLSAMRKTQSQPAYLHGGRAEEVFQAQLDQVLAEKLADASASQFTEPLFNLFNMSRR